MKKLIFTLLGILITGCGYRIVPVNETNERNAYPPMQPGMGPGGITWGAGSFDSLGEQIYFTGIGKDDERIPYSGGPPTGMMMQGYLSCASCHGPDAQGGEHVMHMQSMNAPDIRWESLASEDGVEHQDGEEEHPEEYDLEAFRRAIVAGEHPDGEPLSVNMPRWQMSESEIISLMEYLKSFH